MNGTTYTQVDGLITLPDYPADVGASSHTHANKDILDTITADNVHTHSNKAVIDAITSDMTTKWNKSVPFEDSYVDDCNNWLTNGYTKTSTSTTNHPSVCTGSDKWGVLFYISENATNGTGTQMYFPIDGTYAGRVFTRKILSRNAGAWNLLSTFDGNYDNLTNKPTIPAAYNLPVANQNTLGGIKVGAGLSITADGILSATGGGTADSVNWENVVGKPTFATVATSGSYNDLADKPTIPKAGIPSLVGSNESQVKIWELEDGVYNLSGILKYRYNYYSTETGGTLEGWQIEGLYMIYNAGDDPNNVGRTIKICKNLKYNFYFKYSLLNGTIESSAYDPEYIKEGNSNPIGEEEAIIVLPDNLTAEDYYNLPAGLYRVTTDFFFNVTTNCQLHNGLTNDGLVFSNGSLISCDGQGLIVNLSYSVYLSLNNTGEVNMAGSTNNAWIGELATVATSGDYNDLTNKPTIPTAYTHPATHPASMITGLSTVATSGSYADLTNKPTIPTVTNDLTNELKANYDTAYTHSQATHAPTNAEANVQADWNVTDTGSDAYIKNKPTIPAAYSHPATHPASMITGLANVATSGSYNDLSNKPTIPSTDGLASTTYVDNRVAGIVNSAPETLDTLNELAQALGNDPNFATTIANQIGTKVDKVTGKGLSTNDLTDTLKSNYDTAYTHSQSTHAPNNAQKNSDITKAEIEAKLTGNITTHTHNQYLTEHQSLTGYAKTADLSTVATSGSYNDLSNKPTIPTAYTHPDTHPASMITGLSTVATSGSYNDLTNKPTIPTIPSSLPANGGNADTVGGYTIWTGTQAQYNAISNKSSTTIYLIKEG